MVSRPVASLWGSCEQLKKKFWEDDKDAPCWDVSQPLLVSLTASSRQAKFEIPQQNSTHDATRIPQENGQHAEDEGKEAGGGYHRHGAMQIWD